MSLSHHRPGRPARRARPRSRRDGGYVLAKFALLLVPLLLMTGLSVDVGYWYNRAADIQKAADAAALAGVVWLPDIDAATIHAKEAAARNGFVQDVDGVDIDIDPAGERRLRVTITDDSVGSFLFLSLGGRDIDIGREGLAEYVLPVPMGSPYNFFGTGGLTSGVTGSPLASPTLIYQSINPACTSKVQGDRHQSLHFGGSVLATCPQAASNLDYRDRGYELYIEAHKDRTANLEVLLYDPRYNGADINTGGCTYPTTWTGPNTTSTSDIRITASSAGTMQYQTRPNSTTTTQWSTTFTLSEGQSYTHRRDRIRYRQGTCNHDAGLDNLLNTTYTSTSNDNESEDEDFTFSLFAADNTPLTDTDNPAVAGCSRTFEPGTAFERSLLGSVRWNLLCTITPTMPDGRYVLRVQNEGQTYESFAEGSNQWGLVAKFAGAAGDGLCDGRSVTICPRVYGKDAISVYADTANATATFFLAEIAPEHTGKTLELELWDPGEGGDYIQFMKPTGADAWTATNFSWVSFNNDGTQHDSGNNVPSVSVDGSPFNGKLLRIRIPLTGYNPPANNRWWKILYKFGGSVTDRTTWSARVVGDPVHLLEEEAP